MVLFDEVVPATPARFTKMEPEFSIVRSRASVSVPGATPPLPSTFNPNEPPLKYNPSVPGSTKFAEATLLALTVNVPACTHTAPFNVFAPDKTKLPAPCFARLVTPEPLPAIAPP